MACKLENNCVLPKKKMTILIVSEVHKQWGNEKRDCMCLSLNLRPIKKQAALGLAPFSISIFGLKKKDRRLYICSDKIRRGVKFCHQDLVLNVNSKK